MRMTIVAGLILTGAASAAETLNVKVIERQDKVDGYDYFTVYNNVAVP
jgi:hypothetical protein